MSDNWRERVKEREMSETIDCRRCEHGRVLGDLIYCPKYLQTAEEKARGSRLVGTGYSGRRNDAPFCRFFKTTGTAGMGRL